MGFNMDDCNDKPKLLQKFIFIMNALDDGWSVKKQDDRYIFTKKHENRREVFDTNYLETFITTNMCVDTALKRKN